MLLQPHNSKVDEAVGSHTVNSSKFAQWFHEEGMLPSILEVKSSFIFVSEFGQLNL